MFIFKLRRARQNDWMAVNPILAAGEPGVEIDTGKFKIGDGIREWVDLDYFVPHDPMASDSLPEHILSELPHPVYDDGASLELLYENAKV